MFGYFWQKRCKAEFRLNFLFFHVLPSPGSETQNILHNCHRTENSLIFLILLLEFVVTQTLLAGRVVAFNDFSVLLVDLFDLFEDGCETHCYRNFYDR